jgi:hypothetical protein
MYRRKICASVAIFANVMICNRGYFYDRLSLRYVKAMKHPATMIERLLLY